jgi:L-alanine-DL-glutamate epimerase-like enolase superfamily enzyme
LKITRVEAVPLAVPFAYGGDAMRLGTGASWKKLDFCLVRVDTDAGLTGWGEAFAYTCRGATAAAVTDMIAPLALGHDARDIAGLAAKIQKQLHLFGRFGITAFALSGLDIALWDLAGKAAGVPLHRLIGGARRDAVACYASLLRYARPPLVAQHCQQALGEGYAAIKLHEIADEAVAAARGAIGPATPLLLDVNCEWRPMEAIAAGRRLRTHELGWFEEPVFPPEDFGALRAVGEACGIPIAAGENLCFATQFEAMLAARAVQIAQPSVTKVGGITEFLKVLALAETHNVRVAPHSPYFGPGALATLHLIAAHLSDAWFEYFWLKPEAKLYGALLDPVNGVLGLPQAPGLGADPDPEVLRRYRAG